ncbi:MAG: recombinase family protein [Pseudomonadota bacterium]
MKSEASTRRCAVYTRKSTEDGLEQEFNSLHAQREACEAYILSQRHEGWTLVETYYDDGGFSGGNMERPGLKALLDDVENGLIDVILVYKVDRLTRSLADFAKIVDQLDAKEASFVSVTQAFNTTNSMGRLTLNVLLSFAQFEREVTGERIRDKIAASKKKGLWMGGPVPLGYEVVDRKLIPVAEEAERVRTIMRRYIASRSANDLIEQLESEGIKTKVQKRTSGPHRGGIPFRRGSLFHLLKNAIYRGKIVHKGEVYEGEHEAIVDEELWKAVQERLRRKAPPRRRTGNDPHNALLRGLLTDPKGRPMVPTYTTKRSRRYAYYETRKDLALSDAPKSTRIGQRQLEKHLIDRLIQLLEDEHALRRLSGENEGAILQGIFAQANEAARALAHDASYKEIILKLIAEVQIREDRVHLRLDANALNNQAAGQWNWSIPLPTKRPSREAKLRISASSGERPVDQGLIKLLGEALLARELVLASPELSLNQIANRERRCRKQLAKLVRLSWLSPKVVDVIVDGGTLSRLTRKRLLETELPLDWAEQEKLLGIKD